MSTPTDNTHPAPVGAPADPPHDTVFTTKEAAAYMKVGPKAIRRLVRLKRIRAQRIDRKGTVRIHRAAIDEFLLGEKAVP